MTVIHCQNEGPVAPDTGGCLEVKSRSTEANRKWPARASFPGRPVLHSLKVVAPVHAVKKHSDCRQHFLNRLPDPQGQRSFRPSFSVSSLWTCTILTPRFTFVSDGKPLRRLLIVSKKRQAFEVLLVHDPPPCFVKWAMKSYHGTGQKGRRFEEKA